MPTSEGLHEDASTLAPATVDRHRALASLGEELEAVDWYDQRVDATHDDELRAILAHNRDEEKEHAAMTLEWLRRHDPELNAALRTYLFTESSIVGHEAAATSGGTEEKAAAPPGHEPGSLGIGSLKRRPAGGGG